MREFPNPVIFGRGGRLCRLPAIWESDGGQDKQLPVTPRRLLLLACHGTGDGRPVELAFSRTNNRILDQIEPQEIRSADTLLIDTEQLNFIRPWLNKQVIRAWQVDGPFLIDAFDEIIDKKELKAVEPETSDNGAKDTADIGHPANQAQEAESPS